MGNCQVRTPDGRIVLQSTCCESRPAKLAPMKDPNRPLAPSTVGRGRKLQRHDQLTTDYVQAGRAHLFRGDSLQHYGSWPAPSVIVSDGGYGILGFEGDT